MTCRRPFTAFVGALFALPAVAAGQGIDPPIPTGPPVVIPVTDLRKPAWLEDGPTVIPAAAITTASDATWPGGHVESSCNFDVPGGGSSWMSTEPAWCQVLAGAYFRVRLGPTIPTFNYLPVSVRQGWDVGNPSGLGSGHWEIVGDLTGAAITSSYGSAFGGASLLFRYNWLDNGNPVVPYTQFGAGGVFNDAFRHQDQRAVGALFEFYLHAELGFKCFVTPNLSLDIEGGLQHISNASLAGRNLGVNALGGQIGFTYYFPWGCP